MHIGKLPTRLAYLSCLSPAAARLAHQSLLARRADGGVAGFDAELVVDRAQVRIHRAATDDQPLGDLGVAQFLGEQA